MDNKNLWDKIQTENVDSKANLKFFSIVFGKSVTTPEEIQGLIEYFQEKEEYEFCIQLKKALDELVDN